MSRSNRLLALAFAALVTAQLGCLPEPTSLPLPEAGTVAPPSLAAFDGGGAMVALDDLPRRPRLALEGLLEDASAAPVLVAGELDASLLADAARAPWSAETLARLLPCEVRRETDRYVLAPRAALVPGAALVLVVPAWARDQRGLSIARPLAFALRVRATEGGAALAQTFPADGATGVPASLVAFDVRFDDRVEGLEALELVDVGGGVVPTMTSIADCAGLGFEPGSCARLRPRLPLELGHAYRLRIPETVRDRFGDVPSEVGASFRVQGLVEVQAPVPLALTCATDERPIDGYCVLVQDERVSIRARFARPTRVSAAFAGVQRIAVDRFGDVRIEWTGLGPETVGELAIASEALDGTRLSSTHPLSTEPRLAPLVIAEVRADAVGPEPAQEYVELWNASSEALEIGGFRLSDAEDREGDALPATLRVEADARILVVADTFDPLAPQDVRPPPGATLARIGSSLGSSGLTNGGEPLFLRDTLGRRVAEMPAVAAPGPGICVVRIAPPGRASPASVYGIASHRSCTPGTP